MFCSYITITIYGDTPQEVEERYEAVPKGEEQDPSSPAVEPIGKRWMMQWRERPDLNPPGYNRNHWGRGVYASLSTVPRAGE